MRRAALMVVFAMVVFAMVARASDTLEFRNGTSLDGKFVSIDREQVSFMIDGEVKSYARAQVAKIRFGSESTQPAHQKIAIGQTVEEVTAMLGQPKRIVEAGAKNVYFYPDLKITFVDGKVSSVE